MVCFLAKPLSHSWHMRPLYPAAQGPPLANVMQLSGSKHFTKIPELLSLQYLLRF